MLVMFFVLVVVMLSRAIMINGPGMARMSDRANDGVLAEVAADAGASYARMQLRSDGQWKGNKNAVTVNTPDLIVIEDNGNVVGWLSGGVNSEASMFRIRFNFQDGPGGPDGLDDPQTYQIDNSYLSVNNLTSLADTIVPDVNPSTFRVDDSTVGNIKVSKGSAMIRVEGWAGDALVSTTGPVITPPPGHLSSSVVRAVYARSIDPTLPDAALSAGNGIYTELEVPAEVTVIGAGTAKLRSKKGVQVKDHTGADNVLTMTGQVGRSDSAGLQAVHSGVLEMTEEVGDGNDFANITWDDVPVASSDPGVDVQLPGGVYCIDNDGVWRYYDMDLAAFKSLTPDPATSIRPGGQILSEDFAEVRGANVSVGGLSAAAEDRGIHATKNVNIKASGNGVEDFVLCNLSGRPMVEGETAATSPFLFDGPATPTNTPMGKLVLEDSILSTKGNATLLVNVMGLNGSITTEGKANISASSVTMELLDIKQRLSIYAQDDLQISTYLSTAGFNIPAMSFPPFITIPAIQFPAYDGYLGLKLEGLIYSWGDVTIQCGTPGQANSYHSLVFGGSSIPISDHGTVEIKGAVVAYGGNPGDFDPDAPPNPAMGPGSQGDGAMKIYGRGAKIEYDRTKLANPEEPVNPGIPVERRAYLHEK